MSNLNDGVGKKIVEALKKQTEIEAGNVEQVQPEKEPENLGIDVSSIDAITNNGLLSDDFDKVSDELARAQTALDVVNNQVKFEIDL